MDERKQQRCLLTVLIGDFGVEDRWLPRRRVGWSAGLPVAGNRESPVLS